MPSESRDTNELIECVRRGEPGAVDQLLAAQREPLRRMIDLRLDPALAARLDASDVVQDVLLEVSQRLADYLREPKMPFHLWLRHIAKDHMIDAHRRHRQAQRRSLDREQTASAGGHSDRSSLDLLAQFRDPELTPASAAVRQELERRVAHAIGALDDEDREIILMRNCEQLSNQEVATVLGLSEAAASMRHLRAVRRLKTLLGPEP